MEHITPYQLGYWLKPISADIVPINGVLFVNYRELSVDALMENISTYESPLIAQQYMNIVLLDGFISEICGDEWNDEDASSILETISKAWTYQVLAKYPSAKIKIEIIAEPEYGDLGLRLIGTSL